LRFRELRRGRGIEKLWRARAFGESPGSFGEAVDGISGKPADGTERRIAPLPWLKWFFLKQLRGASRHDAHGDTRYLTHE